MHRGLGRCWSKHTTFTIVTNAKMSLLATFLNEYWSKCNYRRRSGSCWRRMIKWSQFSSSADPKKYVEKKHENDKYTDWVWFSCYLAAWRQLNNQYNTRRSWSKVSPSVRLLIKMTSKDEFQFSPIKDAYPRAEATHLLTLAFAKHPTHWPKCLANSSFLHHGFTPSRANWRSKVSRTSSQPVVAASLPLAKRSWKIKP